MISLCGFEKPCECQWVLRLYTIWTSFQVGKSVIKENTWWSQMQLIENFTFVYWSLGLARSAECSNICCLLICVLYFMQSTYGGPMKMACGCSGKWFSVIYRYSPSRKEVQLGRCGGLYSWKAKSWKFWSKIREEVVARGVFVEDLTEKEVLIKELNGSYYW